MASAASKSVLQRLAGRCLGLVKRAAIPPAPEGTTVTAASGPEHPTADRSLTKDRETGSANPASRS